MPQTYEYQVSITMRSGRCYTSEVQTTVAVDNTTPDSVRQYIHEHVQAEYARVLQGGELLDCLELHDYIGLCAVNPAEIEMIQTIVTGSRESTAEEIQRLTSSNQQLPQIKRKPRPEAGADLSDAAQRLLAL